MTIITIFILCFLSGLLNSTEDLLKDKYHQSIFKNFKHKWFTYDSWKNKYVNGDPKLGRTKIKVFKFEFIKPVQFTDWWHFSKMLSLTFLFLSMFLFSFLDYDYKTLLLVIIAGCIRNIGFMLGYKKFFFIG